jgi:hypothetical protein
MTKVKAQPGTEHGLLHEQGFCTVANLREFAATANRLNLDLMAISQPMVALRGPPRPETRRL